DEVQVKTSKNSFAKKKWAVDSDDSSSSEDERRHGKSLSSSRGRKKGRDNDSSDESDSRKKQRKQPEKAVDVKSGGGKKTTKITMAEDDSESDFEFKPLDGGGKKPQPDSSDDDDDDDDDSDPPPPKKKPARAAPAAKKSRRKEDSKFDTSDEDVRPKSKAAKKKVGKTDDWSSDSDEDFKPKSKAESAGSDEDDEDEEWASEEDKPKPKPVKKKRSASPKKKSTAKKPAAKKAKAEKTPAGPPKYHPPSSKLIESIPLLAGSDIINKPHAASADLPSLPNNNPNFSIDPFTPRCLEGLTFVFSGILTTNPSKTLKDSASISLSSPSKGDYYSNRNAESGDPNVELARDTASDLIKMLGGRVTSAVSSKTDYLVLGSVLEDGRGVEEGSKFRKTTELWNQWKSKWNGNWPSEDRKVRAKKDYDPNNLVEVIRGVYELYGLVSHLSEWKLGTLGDEERREVEEARAERTGTVKKEASAPAAVAAAGNPNAAKPAASNNPYAKSAAVNNPYAKPAASNPYAKKNAASNNPYAKAGGGGNNPYAKSTGMSAAEKLKALHEKNHGTSSSSSGTTTHPSGKELGPNALWADKYSPSSSRDILGNGDSVKKLKRWLNEWEGTFMDSKRKVGSLTNPNPNAPKKAALLSGPPGIGKTTTATLVARETGRDVLELNASDARSKKALTEALGDVTGSHVICFDKSKAKVSDNERRDRSWEMILVGLYSKLYCWKCDLTLLLCCRTCTTILRNAVWRNVKGNDKHQKRVIIMDEVDGMGAGDRSGMAELIQMIKKSKVPIICICNDRQSQKVKSLAQYCLDLRYRRPTKGVIAKRAMHIGKLEGMEVEQNAAESIAESCGNDIRQVLNALQMDRQSDINKDEVLRVSMFDACRTICEGAKNLAGADARAANASLMKRTDAFFVDYALMGLMVHQNYPKVLTGMYNRAKVNDDDDEEEAALNAVYDATEAMSDFGLVEEHLRGGDQNWSLLPLCSILAVKVGHHAGGPNGGFVGGNPEFAGWLGKNSSRGKRMRLLQELRRHLNHRVSADAPELRMNYLPRHEAAVQ
ncbi:hypothetical protein THAOC_16273, partial [Thalassiosira oceanica]